MGKIKLILGALLLLVSYYSSASVIMFYDRAEWELAANAMGLEVSTNDFSSPPLLFSPPPTDLFDPTGRFTIKETSWNILGGTYNSSEGNLIQAGNFDLGLSIDRLPESPYLYGLGFQTLDSVARITIRDINGDWFDSRFCCEPGRPITGFVGILSTSAIQPTDNNREVTIDGIPMSRIDNFSIAVSPIPATIDIKPGSDPNSINLKSKGVIPVAVLGSKEFYAPVVDFSTVEFGPGKASPVHDGHVEDVNGDGFDDMVFHFKTQETGIACGDTDATLTGEADAGDIQFTGTDTVKTVGCNGSTQETSISTKGAGAMSWIFLVGLSVLGLWRRNR